jgi:ATP-dependent DNA helicase PIF1
MLTYLRFPTRAEVENANNMRMRNLQGGTRIFEARDGGSIVDKEMRDKLLSNCMAPAQIALKKGAQVMLIKNIDDTLVNGSLGKVLGFMSETQFGNYVDNEDDYFATQAMSSSAEAKRKLVAEPVEASAALLPLVRFTVSDGTSRDLLCQRESWKIELPNGEVQASRTQVPLILAWALSIHKAQGQTLERVRVNLSRVFEKGQAYVALSRATSMAGLQVIGFDPAKVMAHEAVRRFYASLSRAEETKANSTTAVKHAPVGDVDDGFAFGDEPDWDG